MPSADWFLLSGCGAGTAKMEESNKVTVQCLSTFEDLDRMLRREGLQWDRSSKQHAVLETLKRLGNYSAQRVLKKLVQLGEFKWDEENDFEVEAILDYSKEFTDFGVVVELYLIKWKGWTNVHNTWEPKEHLDCSNLLEEFHKLRDSEASRSQILARMSELTSTAETLSMQEKLHTLSFKLADKNILPEKLMQIARETSKRRVECLSSQTAKRHKTNEGKVNITNKRTKAYKVLKAEMDLVLKQWETQMNKVDINQAPIVVENKVDLDGPPDNFIYTNDYIEGTGIVIPQDPLVGCDCENCLDEKKSCCGPNAGSDFAYYKNKRVRVKPGTPIYECNKYCKCPRECPNRVVQFGRQHKVCLFKTSNGRGWGVKAMQKIKKGSFVVEYVGEVITHEEAERRGKIYDGAGRTYLFDLDYNDDDCPYTVDAGNYGNISHFINHSCDPNLVVYGVWINTLDPRLPRIALFSQRDIQKGEELTFDYMMTADTPGGFGVRAQEAKRLERSMHEDGALDAVSDTTSEGPVVDPTKESVLEKLNEVENDDITMKPPQVSTEVPVTAEALTPLSIDQPLVDAVPPADIDTSAGSADLTPVGADLSALEVKAEVSAVEDMPPTPPPSEIQEASPQLKKSPQLTPFKRFRVVCQCGAKNCRGFLY